MSFICLPLDILRHIFLELNVKDVLNTGSACKTLQDAIADHHVWLPRVKKYRARVPVSPNMAPVTSLTTEQLRSQVIFQARLDLRWSQIATQPVELSTFEDPHGLRFTILSPGGQYLVCIYETGMIRLKSIERDSSGAYRLSDVLIDVEGDDLGENDLIDQAELFSTPKFPQFLVYTVYRLENRSYETRVYHLDISAHSITMIRRINTPNGFSNTSFYVQGDVLARAYGDITARFIEISSLTRDDVLVLSVPTPESRYASCSLSMPTPHTIVIYGSWYIQLYHVPDIDFSTTRDRNISVSPVWNWTEEAPARTRFCYVPSVWDASNKASPMLRFVFKSNMHVINLEFTESPTRLTVSTSTIIPIPIYPVVYMLGIHRQHTVTKFQKGLWYRPDRDVSILEVPTINFDDPSRMGSITFPLIQGEDSCFAEMDFDEVSGRVVLVSSLYNNSNLWKYQLGEVIPH